MPKYFWRGSDRRLHVESPCKTWWTAPLKSSVHLLSFQWSHYENSIPRSKSYNRRLQRNKQHHRKELLSRFLILGDPGQLVGSIKCSWWKFTVRSRRAPGHLLLLNQFQKRLNCLLLIGQKKIFLANQRTEAAGWLSCFITRRSFPYRSP